MERSNGCNRKRISHRCSAERVNGASFSQRRLVVPYKLSRGACARGGNRCVQSGGSRHSNRSQSHQITRKVSAELEQHVGSIFNKLCILDLTEPWSFWQRATTTQWTIEAFTHPASYGLRKKTLSGELAAFCLTSAWSPSSWTNIPTLNTQFSASWQSMSCFIESKKRRDEPLFLFYSPSHVLTIPLSDGLNTSTSLMYQTIFLLDAQQKHF